MSWWNRLTGRRREPPGPEVQAALAELDRWLATPTVGYEKKVSETLEALSKAWQVPAREVSAKSVASFFEERLVELQTSTTGLTLEVDTETDWWETPPGHIFSIQARFDRQQVGDKLISGRMYQVGRIGANRYLIVGR